MRRGGAALAASPTMIGAITVLITIVTVFLAYNANTGLPFVPTYRISVEVPNANTLVRGNEARIGGVRVGLVESIEPVQHDDGTVTAKLDLKLDSDVEPLPVDSTADRALALGARAQVPRDPPGHIRRGLSAGLAGAAVRGPSRAGRVRPGPEHVRRAHPCRGPGEPARVRQRAGGPRRRAELGDRATARRARGARAGDEEHRRPRHRPRPLHLGARRDRRRGRPGRRDPGRDVRLPRHHLRGARRRSRGRSSRRRSPKARRPRT